jgi:hypothetical protein
MSGMKESNIISLIIVAISVIALAVTFIQKERKDDICENIRNKMEGSVFCWRCKSQEPIRNVHLSVDGKTPDGNVFMFANVYTYKHKEPFEVYVEQDASQITKLHTGKYPGARYDSNKEE